MSAGASSSHSTTNGHVNTHFGEFVTNGGGASNGASSYSAHNPDSTSTVPSGSSDLGELVHPLSPIEAHNEAIIHHLYIYGFQTGNYSDIILHVHQHSYRLHSIILSRSPYLANLMSKSQNVGPIRVPLEHEPEVTQSGFAIAVGYLYSSVSLTLINPETARGVLAAGCLLGGMNELCDHAYDVCRQSINVDTIDEWVQFIDGVPTSEDGADTPDPRITVFGTYAHQLRDDVFHFLVVDLPSLFDVHSVADSVPRTPNGSVAMAGGRDKLLQIFSRVPFDMFKTAVESPIFQIGSDQTRFKFAKEAIELRKRGVARGSGAEETVVLAFGGGSAGASASAVHVTRKMRKRQLWKVNT